MWPFFLARQCMYQPINSQASESELASLLYIKPFPDMFSTAPRSYYLHQSTISAETCSVSWNLADNHTVSEQKQLVSNASKRSKSLNRERALCLQDAESAPLLRHSLNTSRSFCHKMPQRYFHKDWRWILYYWRLCLLPSQTHREERD